MIPKAKLNALCLAILLFVAVIFATYHLTESPPVWYDEGFYIQSSANLATYGQAGLRVAPNTIEPSSKLITVGYPLIYPLAGWFKIFGVNILSARSLMVLFILVFLIVGYVFVRRVNGPDFALGTLALLATLPTLYGNGKSVLGEVPGLMYLVLFLVCFSIALSATTRKYLWFACAGLLAGLAIATKPQFLVLLPAIAVGVFFAWRQKSINVKEILIASIVGVAPLLLWVYLQFQTGDSLSDVAYFYANNYQIQDTNTAVLENVRRLFVGISPLYLLGVIGVWVSALWIRFRRQELISPTEIIGLVFSLLLIAVYLSTAGWYRYLFGAQAISLLFFPNSAVVLIGYLINSVNPKKIVACIISALAILGAYQVMFSSFVAESYSSDRTAFLENYFSSVPSFTSVFFYNVPEAALFMHINNYYQYFDIGGWFLGKEQLAVIEKGKVDRIILLTDAFSAMPPDSFPLYKVDQTTHRYTILEKI